MFASSWTTVHTISLRAVWHRYVWKVRNSIFSWPKIVNFEVLGHFSSGLLWIVSNFAACIPTIDNSHNFSKSCTISARNGIMTRIILSRKPVVVWTTWSTTPSRSWITCRITWIKCWPCCWRLTPTTILMCNHPEPHGTWPTWCITFCNFARIVN